MNVHVFEISDVMFCTQESRIHNSVCSEIYDLLFCAQESQNSGKCIFRDFRRFVQRTGIPPFLEVHFLRFRTSCSAHRSPIIPESAIFEISDVLFCAQESHNSWKCMFSRCSTSCSAQRSPIIPESAFFEISDVLFFA